MRVLLVEDDFLVAFVVDDALHEAGHHVEFAPSTAEALALVARQGADLALVDVHLMEGHGAGIDLARQLYEQFGVRTMFVSGNACHTRGEPAPMVDALEQPFAPTDVKLAIDLAEKIICGECDGFDAMPLRPAISNARASVRPVPS